jgi:voltage-gated potassium channel
MDPRSAHWERRFEIPVVIAALATIPLLVFERRHLASPGGTLLRVADWLVWTVFALEAVVLAAVAPSRRRWLKDHPMDVAIVVLTLPLIPTAVQALRVLRVLRLLRLLRLAPLSRRVFSLSGLRYAAFLALLVMLAGGTAFASVESTPLHHVSVGDGIYWALSTMTTVGYGDFVPKTSDGRVVAAIVMALGVAFFAMITGAIAQRFLAGEVAEIEEEMGEVEQEMGEVEELVQESEAADRLLEGGQRAALDELRDIALRLQALEARLRATPEFRGDAG